MRDSHNKYTLTFCDFPKLRGRPPTGKAMSVAERQKKHRLKKKQILSEQNTQLTDKFSPYTDYSITRMLGEFFYLSLYCDDQEAEQNALNAWTEIGRRHGWL